MDQVYIFSKFENIIEPENDGFQFQEFLLFRKKKGQFSGEQNTAAVHETSS